MGWDGTGWMGEGRKGRAESRGAEVAWANGRGRSGSKWIKMGESGSQLWLRVDDDSMRSQTNPQEGKMWGDCYGSRGTDRRRWRRRVWRPKKD